MRGQLGQASGDGTPIMLTIPVDEPWVPLRILALGLDRSQVVDADVFLLTDTPPLLHADARDLRVTRSEPASRALLDDLRSDKGMGWVPDAHVVHLPAGGDPRRAAQGRSRR